LDALGFVPSLTSISPVSDVPPVASRLPLIFYSIFSACMAGVELFVDMLAHALRVHGLAFGAMLATFRG
jgi:hypothetical protein